MTDRIKPHKPLSDKGFSRLKAYGSIPHLPGSNFGDRRDKGCPPGEARLYTKKCYKGDTVIATEKLDGSCMAVVKLDNDIIPIGRAGYPATTSPYVQHHYFAAWVRERYAQFSDLLEEGEWICGEWLAQAHGTRYDLANTSPFVAFDLFHNGERILYDRFISRLDAANFIPHVPILWWSDKACSIDHAMCLLGERGMYGAQELAEGAVWRIERKDECVSLAKYVRPEKAIGKYLPSETGKEEVWNWRPSK